MNIVEERRWSEVPLAANTNRRMPDLIFVSLEDWDDIWRRNQFLCASLTRRFPHTKLLFVGTPWNLTYHIRHGSFGKLHRPLTRTLPAFPNITVTNPPKFLPETVSSGRAFNEFIARRHVARVARQLGIVNPLLWLNPPSAVHMAGRMNERSVIYDITDDWCEAPSFSPRERKLLIRQDHTLCRQADLVIVCSEAIAQTRASLCRELLLLPNGVDADHYSTVAASPPRERSESPVLGYTGTLHSDRTDVSLIVSLARAFPAGRVLLVGPNFLCEEERQRLTREPNISAIGPLPYARLPDIMTEFDVCIVPHLETKFTESLNPIKLWEYLASGKPIVSTNVAGFRDYGHLCELASGPQAFVAACRNALSENGRRRIERVREAHKHTWEARVDGLVETMTMHGLMESLL